MHHTCKQQGVTDRCITDTCITGTRIMDTCIMDTYIMDTCIMDTCITDTCITDTCITDTCIRDTCILDIEVHKEVSVWVNFAWVTRPERPKSAKDEVKRPGGPPTTTVRSV